MADDKFESKFDARSFLRTLTTRPGVYRMLDAKGAILYVGKARSLKQRVSSYFRQSGLSSQDAGFDAADGQCRSHRYQYRG